MKKYLWVAMCAAIGLLAGCVKEELPDKGLQSVTVMVSVCPEQMDAITRSADENTIRDLNVYLYDKNDNPVLHLYQTVSTLRFECMPGEYKLRLIANMGYDLGNTNAFTLSHKEKYDVLPMDYEAEISVLAAADGVMRLPDIEMKRSVAKISCTVSVKAADIELRSIRLRSIPKCACLFNSENASSDDVAEYVNSAETTLSGRQGAAEYYMLPNLKGQNTSITGQREKNAANAPKCASYLQICAVKGDKVLSYSVFLGENNTSDFNVKTNAHYTLNIVIVNDNMVDTRIAAYTLSVYDDFDAFSVGNYCTYNQFRYLHVDIASANGTPSITGLLTVVDGDVKNLYFDRETPAVEHAFKLYRLNGDNKFEMDYRPIPYTEANSHLKYHIALTDNNGFKQEYNFEHRMANAVCVHSNNGGSIIVTQSRYTKVSSLGTGKLTTALCLEEGCRFTATPANNHTFDGWYSDAAYKEKLSSAATYTYIPTSPYANLYVRFRAVDTPLDSSGTANCYIATTLGKRYSFSATVMGNGKATLNITPHRLSGTQAKVIWETGPKSGDVIKSVEYADGRIYFTTGSIRGNAVIGLFDTAGVCLWSWHIWSVDYIPTISAQTYASGAIFMDRNLGALTTDYTQPSSRGLVYQWGRKDPFPYAADFSAYSKPASVVYAEGFSYSLMSPANCGKEAEEVMTIEWSRQHPTVFMDAATYSEWDEYTDISDWLYTRHPNLWGNTTTGPTSISKVSYKTIYDPCPPGWRVANAEDFAGIQRASYLKPYYVEVNYNASRLTRYPIGGSFNGINFQNVGNTGRVYTNAPFIWHWDTSPSVYDGVACTSIFFSTTTVPPFIGTTDYFRYSAEAVRCIRE